MKKATFGAGCFWGVEEAFSKVKGIIKTTVGYMGGTLKNPTYNDVCTDITGHIEVIEIEYDPTIITYEKLLDIFWEIHDPTQLNRQGVDVGTQYKSVIFYYDEDQKQTAIMSKNKLGESNKYQNPIVTEIRKVETFYPAEDYHQKYYLRGQCQNKLF
ncbi:MAG: peptide-methionine (S)-S-oxide reductase MsrA [Thermoplasmatales archaeon]|nr:MAG: peptide-methionine (S)-S-oxide reductase MsrA [Thermoplasmatales archaeon]